MAKPCIKVASMDVSCDTHAWKVKEKHGEEYGFEQRFGVQFDEIEKQEADVVNLQEIRFPENLEIIKERKGEKYNVHHFYNNKDGMSFHSLICVRKDIHCEWKDISSKHYWTTIDKNTRKPMLSSDPNARVEKNESENIKGDPHGRCVGVVVLEHKKTSKKLLIASVHVVPFGQTKAAQQMASLSLANMACDITGEDCPVILAGDFNIFNDEREDGTFQLINKYAKSLSLREIPLKKMTIPDMDDVIDPEQIGTFNPWSTDTNAEMVYKQPLGYSKLDAIFASTSLECKDGVTVYPVLMRKGKGASMDLNDPSKMSDEDKKTHTKLRYMFKDKLASDHFLLTAKFTFKIESAIEKK
ncbi:unnamed protein product [Owenia fusiformis]|uniref:Uncharacterized protein n=1 Tax=Owenia fusiformis TaxID=6347 RepID=A0A8J1XKH8_OWEFU|nr:unnamed protein product [Owenia fusiformis]